MKICHLDLSRFYNAPEKQLEILIRTLAEVKGCEQRLFYRKKKNNRFLNNPKISPEMVMMFQMKMNMYENLEHLIKAEKPQKTKKKREQNRKGQKKKK